MGLPNLGLLICGLAVLGFVGKNFLGAPLDRFMFIPELVRQGEWWRIVAYPIIDNPLYLFFFVMYVYYVVGALEEKWGSGPTTFYIFFSYLCGMAGAFIADIPAFLWLYVMENVSLAFGTLFPEVEFYLYFILPVRAKWLTLFGGAVLIYQFFMGTGAFKIFLGISLLPYLIFFGPVLVKMVKDKKRLSDHRKRMNDDMWRR